MGREETTAILKPPPGLPPLTPPPPATPANLSISAPGSISRSTLRRRGLEVKVTNLAEEASARARLSMRGRSLGSSRSQRGAGTGTITLRIGRRAKTPPRGRAVLTIKFRIGGQSVEVERRVTIR